MTIKIRCDNDLMNTVILNSKEELSIIGYFSDINTIDINYDKANNYAELAIQVRTNMKDIAEIAYEIASFLSDNLMYSFGEVYNSICLTSCYTYNGETYNLSVSIIDDKCNYIGKSIRIVDIHYAIGIVEANRSLKETPHGEYFLTDRTTKGGLFDKVLKILFDFCGYENVYSKIQEYDYNLARIITNNAWNNEEYTTTIRGDYEFIILKIFIHKIPPVMQ